MNGIEKYSEKDYEGRDARLLREWREIEALCKKRKAASADPRRPSISYTIKKKNLEGIPIIYDIIYRCKSIVGVEDTQPPRKPIFGYMHKMRIELPLNYPSADGNPLFTFQTPVWHPNIRYAGDFKGKVCLTIKEMGVMASLTSLILRVEEYLKYKMYHAKNTYPYPEDQYVAEWVREEAEPNNWTHFDQNMPEASSAPKATSAEPSANENSTTPDTTNKPKRKVKLI